MVFKARWSDFAELRFYHSVFRIILSIYSVRWNRECLIRFDYVRSCSNYYLEVFFFFLTISSFQQKDYLVSNFNIWNYYCINYIKIFFGIVKSRWNYHETFTNCVRIINIFKRFLCVRNLKLILFFFFLVKLFVLLRKNSWRDLNDKHGRISRILLQKLSQKSNCRFSLDRSIVYIFFFIRIIASRYKFIKYYEF